jgi:hypothetical protein
LETFAGVPETMYILEHQKTAAEKLRDAKAVSIMQLEKKGNTGV